MNNVVLSDAVMTDAVMTATKVTRIGSLAVEVLDSVQPRLARNTSLTTAERVYVEDLVEGMVRAAFYQRNKEEELVDFKLPKDVKKSLQAFLEIEFGEQPLKVAAAAKLGNSALNRWELYISKSELVKMIREARRELNV